MIVEIYEFDIWREPKLKDAIDPFKDDSDYAGLLACGKSKPCAFLKDNKCEIYPTRPTCCVAFEPGDDQCIEFQA